MNTEILKEILKTQDLGSKSIERAVNIGVDPEGDPVTHLITYICTSTQDDEDALDYFDYAINQLTKAKDKAIELLK